MFDYRKASPVLLLVRKKTESMAPGMGSIWHINSWVLNWLHHPVMNTHTHSQYERTIPPSFGNQEYPTCLHCRIGNGSRTSCKVIEINTNPGVHVVSPKINHPIKQLFGGHFAAFQIGADQMTNLYYGWVIIGIITLWVLWGVMTCDQRFSTRSYIDWHVQ